ncbi:HAMP domain-containing sensor histidine kinase [Fusibacter sp. 3D3]|uniref:sensor histidine kinase n=1 Tax=Fusibacter sp. 3D3 TaxID=1048380 RepID=UPI000853E100|nr:HAMP domain-containing sensor histidine kinase [Fusibacter sp. 3D3]GAU76361.1 sensor histidine kinase [Fusibacter sp. 3D3]
MKRSSVVVRLFVLTTLFLVFFVSVAFKLQLKSFEEYYFERKINDIDEKYFDFMALYESSDWSQAELEQNIQYFENQNDIKMAMIDNYYGIINESKYKIFILNDKGRVYEVQLNNVLQKSDYMKLDVHAGDRIVVKGYLWGDQKKNITLMQMTLNDVMVFNVIEPRLNDRLKVDEVEGTVIRFNIPDLQDLIFGVDYTGIAGVVDYYYFTPKSGVIDDESFIYTEKMSGKKQIVKVFPSNRKGLKSIFIMTQQQPIIEATQALSDFYPVLITGSLLIGAIFLFIFSKMISNPLIELEQKAQKMADFDFNEYIEIKHNDEIGGLSRSLNQLSYNLESSIKALNDANAKLLDDLEKDRKLENMRKEFIRNISHELKTPIGVIRAFTEGLQDGIVENDVDYYSGVILEEITTIEALVKDMLELSKLQTGAYRLELEIFKINVLIENVILKQTHFALEKGMNFAFEQCEYDQVFGDYRKIERVVANFVSNAVRYGKSNTTIEIKTSVAERRIRFSIQNECAPLSNEQLDRVWDKFYKVDESRSKVLGGSGLGLAIVKEILEQHQAIFGVENTVEGVVFYFEMGKYGNGIV